MAFIHKKEKETRIFGFGFGFGLTLAWLSMEMIGCLDLLIELIDWSSQSTLVFLCSFFALWGEDFLDLH